MIRNLKSAMKATTAAMLAIFLATSLTAMQTATAGEAGGWTRSSTVNDLVVNNNNGTWTYNYTVNNTSQFTRIGVDPQPFLVDWELPWFGDAGINVGSIFSPGGWAAAIETIGVANSSTGWEGFASWQDPADAFYAGAGSPFTSVTQVLHWYSICWAAGGESCEGALQDAISPGGSLSGFGYVAEFAETDAPYQASWASLPVLTGDPAFPLGGIPASPLALATQVVPEPGLLGLLGIGLVAVMLGRRRT